MSYRFATDEEIEKFRAYDPGYLLRCPHCDSFLEMDISGDFYICPSCHTYIESDAPEIEEQDDDDDIPFGCRMCGGPYPSCKISCKLYDD